MGAGTSGPPPGVRESHARVVRNLAVPTLKAVPSIEQRQHEQPLDLTGSIREKKKSVPQGAGSEKMPALFSIEDRSDEKLSPQAKSRAPHRESSNNRYHCGFAQ